MYTFYVFTTARKLPVQVTARDWTDAKLEACRRLFNWMAISETTVLAVVRMTR